MTELTEGYFNAAYRLTLEDGLTCVLKVAPPDAVKVMRYEKSIMRTEVEVLRLVRADTEMPVPAVYGYDSSRQILPVDYFVMEVIHGVPLNTLRKALPGDTLAAIDRELGRLLRQMNRIEGRAFGYYAQPEFQFPTWRAAFPAMLEMVLADGEALNVPLPYELLRRGLERHFELLEAVEAPYLLHWDLWDGNVFVDPETQHITGIIDFERALWGDPLMEFGFREGKASAAFQEGYGVDLLDTPEALRRRSLYDVYLDLILIIEGAYRQYGDNQQEVWARAKLDRELQFLGLTRS